MLLQVLIASIVFASSNSQTWSGSGRQNRTYIATVVLEAPYVMQRRDPTAQENAQPEYEGLVVDILDSASRRMGFKYKVSVSPEGRYGARDQYGNWDGMIGQLLTGRADIAAAALTMTRNRAAVIDFSYNFLMTGPQILIKKPYRRDSNDPLHLTLLLAPYSVGTWVLLIITFLVVSVVLFLIGRFSPYEWRQHQRLSDPTSTGDWFSLRNSFLFTASTMFLQGFREAPRSLSGRVIGVFWWAFCILTIITYACGLTAYFLAGLHDGKMARVINSFDDLSKQTHIKYGTIFGGSTARYLNTSPMENTKRMWQFMSKSEPSLFVRSPSEGIERVKTSDGQYAFIVDGFFGSYVASQNCDLEVVGKPLTKMGYGFGCPKRSDICKTLNLALLEMREDGTLERIVEKWRTHKSVCYDSEDVQENKPRFYASSLTFNEVASLYVLMLVGIVLSVAVLVVEIVYESNRKGMAKVTREIDITEKGGSAD